MKLSTLRQYLTWQRLRVIGLALLLLLSGFTLYLDFRVRDAFEGRRFALPARLYARPLELLPGLKLAPEALVQELARLGYKETLAGDEPGRFARHGNTFEIVARAFVFWDGAQPARKLRLDFRGDSLSGVHDLQNDQPLTLARLDPLYIGGIYPEIGRAHV